MSDAITAVVTGCLRGDASSMRALVERYYRMVFAVCLRLLGRHDDAEDAVQETFLRAFRSLASYDPNRRFEPWLLTIAINRCRTRLAARRHQPTVEIVWESIADEHSEVSSFEQFKEEVARAVEKLRPEYRQAFLMFHQRGMSYVDISRALGRPINTIKTWIHRARREIVAELKSRDVLSPKRLTR